jgi:hypothetical protein
MTVKYADGGETQGAPMVLGRADGSAAVFVESTGLYEGMLKGRQAWVTGDRVQVGIARGSLVPLGAPADVPVPAKNVQVVDPFDTAPWRDKSTAELREGHETTIITDTETVTTSVGESSVVVVDLEDPELQVSYTIDPSEMSIPKVLAHLEQHPEHLEAVLEAERAGKARKGILSLGD